MININPITPSFHKNGLKQVTGLILTFTELEISTKILLHIKTTALRLDLKKLLVCRHPTQGLQIGSVGRSVGIFFILVMVSLVPRALPLLDISLVAGKRTFIRDDRYNR